jgi:hypothetical protein
MVHVVATAETEITQQIWHDHIIIAAALTVSFIGTLFWPKVDEWLYR